MASAAAPEGVLEKQNGGDCFRRLKVAFPFGLKNGMRLHKGTVQFRFLNSTVGF